MCMDAAEFLGRFSEYPSDGLHVLRRSPVLDRFSADPTEYVAIAREFFAGCNLDWERRARLVQILCEFLYHDGRSFEALLVVAERAFVEPEYFANGVNSLAGIWCYLNMDRPAPLSDEDLASRFTTWMQNEDLCNNARKCRELVFKRRPDLRPFAP